MAPPLSYFKVNDKYSYKMSKFPSLIFHGGFLESFLKFTNSFYNSQDKLTCYLFI